MNILCIGVRRRVWMREGFATGDEPFFSAFCLSAFRWAAAGLRARSLSFAIFGGEGGVWVGCAEGGGYGELVGRECGSVGLGRWISDMGVRVVF